MKPVRVILLDNAKEEFERLNVIVGKQLELGKQSTEEMQLLNSIEQKINLIKLNPFYGYNLAKNLIPKEYNVTNLWRVELSQFWRMLYTITGNELDIISVLLEFMNHDRYNKLFGYKKK